jgi:hypothetical protein
MMGFRHADRRLPFLWEGTGQPPGRWNGTGAGPVQYFSDTPVGAWAEFLRHEEITEPEDLPTITRALWVVDLPDEDLAAPALAADVLTGGPASHQACGAEARRLRDAGAVGRRAPSAALLAEGAAGWRVSGGLQPGPARDGTTLVLFGERPDLVGWHAGEGRPGVDVLRRVRHHAVRTRRRAGEVV